VTRFCIRSSVAYDFCLLAGFFLCRFFLLVVLLLSAPTRVGVRVCSPFVYDFQDYTNAEFFGRVARVSSFGLRRTRPFSIIVAAGYLLTSLVVASCI